MIQQPRGRKLPRRKSNGQQQPTQIHPLSAAYEGRAVLRALAGTMVGQLFAIIDAYGTDQHAKNLAVMVITTIRNIVAVLGIDGPTFLQLCSGTAAAHEQSTPLKMWQYNVIVDVNDEGLVAVWNAIYSMTGVDAPELRRQLVEAGTTKKEIERFDRAVKTWQQRQDEAETVDDTAGDAPEPV